MAMSSLAGNRRDAWVLSGTGTDRAIFLLILAFQAVLTLRHEPWLDEWQALMLAVQSPTLSDLLDNLRYEGHPPLWYLLLRWVSMLTGREYASQALAMALAGFTQWLILCKSPFPRGIRIAMALSEIVLFEFNTISRGYTLGVALTFAVVWLWDRRKLIWLPLVLLPATDFMFGLFSLIFIAMRFRDRRPWLPGGALWLAVSLFSAWSVLPAPDNIPAFPASKDLLTDGLRYLYRLSVVMFPFQWDDGPSWDKLTPAYSYGLLWLPFLVTCLDQTRGRLADRLGLFSFMAAQLGFFMFLHPLTTRHVMLAGVLLMAIHWLQARENVAAGRLFRFWLVIGAACGLVVAAINLAIPFDNARLAAQRIDALGLKDKRWVTYPTMHSPPVTAWNGMLFEQVEHGCEQDFVRWNFQRRYMRPWRFARWARQEAAEKGRFYVLSRYRLRESPHIRKIEIIPAGYDGFLYALYEIGPGLPDSPRSPRRCVPGMRPWKGLERNGD
jgi:hypothetical protein